MVKTLIPYSSYTPEEILLMCARREITPADTMDALEARRDYYRRAIRGQAKDNDYPLITPKEAAEKIGAEENAIETLQAILDPPVFTINSTEIRNQLREIRNRCIVGGCTKKAALALFDQTWLDFKNDTISKANKFYEDIGGRPAGIDSQIRQILDECKDMDTFNEIRVEIEGIPESVPDTQLPEIPGYVLSIAGYYPKFINHYPELENAEYIRVTDTGLQWLKSKQSLAEYFSAIKPEDKSNNWKILENIFGMKDLRNAASQNGNVFKGKKSKDFKELQIITRL
jgi:hypothetical protein